MKPPTRFEHNKKHASYGIKKYLMDRGLCLSKRMDNVNHSEYTEVINSFLLMNYPDFDLNINIAKKENLISKNFQQFTNFIQTFYA